jgi:hypothetical protein
METQIKQRAGRKPTGPTTIIVRIPGALKPAVTELVAHYRQAKQKAWEAQPLRKQEQPDDDADLVAAADATLDRLARGEETTIGLEDWERRHGLGG